MSLKAQLKNPLVQQYILEIVLPLIGYFFFDWSISVIIAFYFIDYFVSEIARHRRHYKIMKHWNESKVKFMIALFTSILLFAMATTCTILLMALYTEVSDKPNLDEIIDFFKSEGWLILPIVYLAYYMKDTMTFYAPRRYAKYNFRQTLKAFYLEASILMLLIVIGVYVWAEYKVEDVPALLIFIAIKLVFDQIFVRRLKKMSMKA